MTLAIGVLTSSGIVLTADSRQTYRNNAGMVRIGSDNAMKMYRLNDRAGVVVSGKAFIADKSGRLKDIGTFIEAFRELEGQLDMSVKDIALRLNDYLSKLFVDKEMLDLKKQIEDRVKALNGSDLVFKKKDGVVQPYSFKDKDGKPVDDAGNIDTVQFIVGGFDLDKVGRAYSVSVPAGITLERDTERGGAVWIGQSDVVNRIILGFDGSMGNLLFMREALDKDTPEVKTQLAQLEYIINWGTMTLQDAIDLSVLMTRTTESIQRFSDGTSMSPGGITGVGGDIAVSVITSIRGFVWVKKKTLSAEGSTIDLDALQDSASIGVGQTK